MCIVPQTIISRGNGPTRLSILVVYWNLMRNFHQTANNKNASTWKCIGKNTQSVQSVQLFNFSNLGNEWRSSSSSLLHHYHFIETIGNQRETRNFTNPINSSISAKNNENRKILKEKNMKIEENLPRKLLKIWREMEGWLLRIQFFAQKSQ